MTIAEFLEARIAEDEAVAHAATDGPWRLDPGSSGVYRIEVGYREFASDPEGLTFYAERDWKADAEHIARHDPARVLVECAAKRAVIHAAENCETYGDQVTVLRALATAHKDHPDYDQGWAL